MPDFGWEESLYQKFRETDKEHHLPANKKENVFQEGDDAMMRFARAVSSVPGKRLWDFQKELLNLIMTLVVPSMYFNIWNRYRDKVLARYNLTLNDLLIIASTGAPRRAGKSTLLQLVAAALAITTPTCKNGDYPFGVGLVSINLGASKKMIDDILDIIDKMPNKPEGITIHSNATFIKITFADGRDNRIYGFQTGQVSCCFERVGKERGEKEERKWERSGIGKHGLER